MNPLQPDLSNHIPIAVSFDPGPDAAAAPPQQRGDKKRLLYISALAVAIAAVISVVARLLVYLINLITNLSFHHQFSLAASSPATHHYGAFVILIPAIGGGLVGLMALYGSKAIRGHGIPEAMEQILTNESRIRPSITYLKPLSAALSIGTGGPFGAEGPIIATGGAFGSMIGQVLKISSYERKILLAAGATAGMSAIFGSPIAAIFLAIELLLFEFSPRSIIPVALACITGAAGHHFLFETGPAFPSPAIAIAGNSALAVYSVIGLLCGGLAAGITKLLYAIEDGFEKLPIHWAWWPALGGLVVGLVGYVAPHTLGVGYENISALLSGKTELYTVIALCGFKFLSWAVALGSGTSGGTLAPLLTIGGAAGALLGMAAQHFFPGSGVTITLAALVGMSALFAGASRALLTSIIFAIETTQQSNALLPLLAACLASYVVSYLLMKNTIMTEKIARRGVTTPHVYQPDLLENKRVGEVIGKEGLILSGSSTLEEVREWLKKHTDQQQNFYIVADAGGVFKGIISSSNLFSLHHPGDTSLEQLIKRKPFAITESETLKTAVEMMARENLDVLAVIDPATQVVAGMLSYKDILSVYRDAFGEHEEAVAISLKQHSKRLLFRVRPKLRADRK
ncbi:MAG: CBS domain-containing protein [Chitinophagaceae bacterium]|nr:MAG: CBS domain-containing protein [Chitinophagaceae bacterium]